MNDSSVALHYERTGQGEPLIVLHGLFGSLSNWRPVAQKLGEHFEVISVDLRNHGRSPHASDFSFEAMAHDLQALTERLELPKAHVLGHSLGGKVAMQFALTQPEAVGKLIVVDATPCAMPERHRRVIDALLNLDLNAATSRRELDAQLAPHLPEAALRQFLLMNVETRADGNLGWRIGLEAINAGYEETNKAIEATQAYPGAALFIRGGNSDYIGAEDIEAIEGSFPRAEVVTIAGAGHWVHAEQPDEFVRVVLGFLGA